MSESTLDKQLLVRIMVMVFIVMLMLSILIIRLWDVQILSGSEFNEKASRQYARSIRLPALRGRIFSADGKLLAANRPTVEVLFHLSEMPISGNQKKSAEMIMAELLRAEIAVGRCSTVTEQPVLAHLRRHPDKPLTVFKALDWPKLAKLAALQPAVPGLKFSAEGTLLTAGRPTAEVLFDLSAIPLPGSREKSVKTVLAELLRAGEAVGKTVTVTDQQILSALEHSSAPLLTVFRGLSWDELARLARLEPAIPGLKFSVDGKLLSAARPKVEVLLYLSELPAADDGTKTGKTVLAELLRAAAAIGTPSSVTEQPVLFHMQHYPGIPMTVFKELDGAELARLAELQPAIPGLDLSAGSGRWYPYRSLACQIIGYTGPLDAKNAEDRGNYFYYLPETIGKAGLERLYNHQLQGIPGMKLVKVNHRGFVHETIDTPTPAQPSQDLILTLDARMQAKSEQLLQGRSGAAVVMDASDGSILAMASRPGFDLNRFIPRIRQADYDRLKDDPAAPLLNKAAQSAYLPGSIVKPLVALAVLENGIPAETEINCDGATRFGEQSYIRCWAWLSGGHGPVSLTDAVKVSCNDYFCESGMELGVDKLRAMYQSAGIGSRTGYGLPEAAGILPDRNRWRSWNAFDTALVSIGQGKIQLSPLQAVSYTAAIANGGTLWKPRLVREFRNPETGKSTMEPPVRRGQLNARPENLAIVREGMFRAVNEAGGGARRAYCADLPISGKTGTAEVGPRGNRKKNTWFIGFAELPSGRKLAVCVLVLDGESGNKTAAPVALELFKFALRLNL